MAGTSPGATSETYPVPAQAVRPGERALRLPTTADGDTAFTLLGLTTGLAAVQGSHAELEAQGQYVRVRMSVVNNGRSSVAFDARRHVLLDDRGAEHRVDAEAMTIRRQPDQVDLGSNVRLEYDVYYDLPEEARPAALRVFGGPTLTDLRDRSSTDIPLGK
ncbi:hypothetical protein GCM10010185_23290 [Saccharothrix coeruleofusca]|uniref:DUF4352 domain-containing protein n=1 Tax=Saccharothrix coeruleofusca TaxID=33919 RepID=A0A918AMS0_9PSEU|nr:hypothetical protein GCM10010185_23290 [Saccharothrix coeruleofusca]